VADLNILERLFGILSTGTYKAADPLENEERFPLERRRLQFDPIQGEATGEPEPPQERFEYDPGMLDLLARESGFASDDRFQLESKLEFWRSPKSIDDRQRLKEYLER
jgi:hypothetical protein